MKSLNNELSDSSKKHKDWECPICGEMFASRRKLTAHKKQSGHKKSSANPTVICYCRFCGSKRTTRTALSLHEKYCTNNPNKIVCVGHKVSEGTKKKISETCKKNKLSGGYRHGSGRGKKGTYKGYYCDSSWELAYVIYNLEHNVKFKRNEKLFPYVFNGEQHNYKPDFIEGDTYVEIKGYFNEQVKAKEEAFPFKLKYIDKDSIEPYIEYVEKTYGKDFTRLYE